MGIFLIVLSFLNLHFVKKADLEIFWDFFGNKFKFFLLIYSLLSSRGA